MKIYYRNKLSEKEVNELTLRPALRDEEILSRVRGILTEIKTEGIDAVEKISRKFDDPGLIKSKVELDEIDASAGLISSEFKEAIDTAYKNIHAFHSMQKPEGYSMETTTGVNCELKYLPLESVGLYVPGGTAPLPSTVLMLGVPAQLAGCNNVIMCTPSKGDKINPAILYAAKLCGIKEIYKYGGAQAIGFMSFVKGVNKIFGPGNQYVTYAKQLVSSEMGNCAIDMPAGPSEVLVLADENANAIYIAADLLAQAEHGVDSQAVLVTESSTLAENVSKEVSAQLTELPRKDIASKSIENSFILIYESIEESIDFVNEYAPEHLILNLKKNESVLGKIKNAGSVFVGEYTPESAGDYASGTNHTLPTSGYAKAYGGVSLLSFFKTMTIQRISKEGLKNLAGSIITIAEAEELQAHANAVRVRLEDGNN